MGQLEEFLDNAYTSISSMEWGTLLDSSEITAYHLPFDGHHFYLSRRASGEYQFAILDAAGPNGIGQHIVGQNREAAGGALQQLFDLVNTKK